MTFAGLLEEARTSGRRLLRLPGEFTWRVRNNVEGGGSKIWMPYPRGGPASRLATDRDWMMATLSREPHDSPDLSGIESGAVVFQTHRR